MRKRLFILTCLNLLVIKAFGAQIDLQGPIFLHEPARRVEFSNTSGGKVDCQAHGVPLPALEWILTDGTTATQIKDIRIIHGNGSLIFPPFPAEKFRHDVHTAIYRCIAKNQIGLILSREVVVKAVVNQKYDVQVYDEYVITGNTAILRCQVPNYLTDYVLITSWTQDDVVHIYPTSDTGGKYVVLKTGELCIFNIGPSDAFKSYSCRTVNKLTGKSQSSIYPARVIITEVKESVQPRMVTDKHSTKYVKVDEDALLPCVAHGFPVPTYRWFKEEKEQLFPVPFGDRITEVVHGLLHISKVKADDRGKYVCVANNSAGKESVRVNLVVTAPVSVHVQPQSQVVDVNKEAVFACVTTGFPIGHILWFHNGKSVLKDRRHTFKTEPERLLIKPVQKEDQGMYQCFVSNEWDMAQSTAELQLGDSSPELLSWFAEKTLQPGPPLSLKCSATGNPPPHFSWSLDGFPVPDNNRFMVGQYITVNDDVITHLNISGVEEEDGGEYTCTAKNSISQVSYSARINVYGRPFIRTMPMINAVAGEELIIKCPVAGYPIESISWEQGGVSLPVNRRQKVFNANGTLVIESVQKQSDAGTYTCQARNNNKLFDRRDVEVRIMVPPKILPIQEIVLREGMRAAITCQVIEGDLPFKFRWERNGVPVTNSKLQIRRVDEYASLLVIDNISTVHTGNYTCSAENVAGMESFTVPLTVNVPPKWQIEPTDVSVAAGHDVVLDCQATGHPVPSVVWKKSIGEFLGEYKDFLYEPNTNFYHNGSLRFVKVSKENEGHYLCEAKNEVGSGVSKLIFLKVNVQAHFPQKFKQMQVIQGEETHLQCPALGDTPIEIQWKVNGQRLQEDKDPRYVIREQPLDEGLVSELGISHTHRHDTGVFTCYAANAFGQDEMKIQLIVQEIPEVPKNIRVSDQQSRSLRVSWTQPYAGNSPITNYIIEYKFVSDDWEKHTDRVIVGGTQTVATLQELHPSNAYHIRIMAENRLGKSEPSETIQVTTQEEAPTGPPLEVVVEAESSTEIKVTWKPPARNMWNGKLLGYYVGYQEHSSGFVPSNLSTNYNFRTVETGVQYGGETLIQRLKKFSTYSVVVQAFNGRGPGPASEAVVVRTKEDVPSSPPEDVRCNTMSSQSIEVLWEPPNVEEQHGVLLGYKVSYQPADNWYYEEELETKVTTLTKTIISGLLKYANYSVTLLAFTSAGDGVKSESIFCKTDEDVPSSPKDIKAAVSSPTKIMVAWLPPRHKNGQLICYTIYMSLIEDGKEEGTHKRIIGPDSGFHETVRHQDKATYQFWVTASTRIGEGESSRVVTIPPSNRVPARIMSFSRNIVTPWKQTLNLTCKRVGLPAPQSTWTFKERAVERSNGRRQIHKDGSLIIKDVQKTDQGNYSCSVENVHGKDKITYNLIVEVPPERPKLSIISSTSDSLQLEWTIDNSNKDNILGYVINYKRDHGDWEELQIGARITSYSLQNLWCATRYQLYVTAFNKIGMGLPCDIVNGFTMGSVPAKPKATTVVTVNATSASVWVDSWLDGGCPIAYFIIEYRTSESSSWALASNSVQPSDRVFVLSDLRPNCKYNVRVTAHNNAGSSVAVYNFTTLMPIGGSVIPTQESEKSLSEDVPFYYNLKIIVIVFVMSTIITTLIILGAFIRRRRLIERHLTTLGESPSIARIQNEQNRDQHYLAIQIQKKGSDTKSISGKDDYMSDICPYAAFKISQPPYSESSYSGNIYSGAYSSVKDSFPFHDLNSDSYKVKPYKESDYTKIRRRGGKQRDLHSESQVSRDVTESDNLGSTDSEVKKILSMHLPISEYDTLGSDSEGESQMCSRIPDQDLPPFRRTPRTGKRDPRMKSAGDDSSTSSETSRTEFKLSMRKTKSKGQSTVKRHVRNSSGYSSHTEETTFSSHPTMKISSLSSCRPSMVSPVECEKLRGKRSRSSSKGSISGKFNRDTSFQIDV